MESYSDTSQKAPELESDDLNSILAARKPEEILSLLVQQSATTKKESNLKKLQYYEYLQKFRKTNFFAALQERIDSDVASNLDKLIYTLTAENIMHKNLDYKDLIAYCKKEYQKHDQESSSDDELSFDSSNDSDDENTESQLHPKELYEAMMDIIKIQNGFKLFLSPPANVPKEAFIGLLETAMRNNNHLVNLSGINLSNQLFEMFNFRNLLLENAEFANSKLFHCEFNNCILISSNFNEAKFCDNESAENRVEFANCALVNLSVDHCQFGYAEFSQCTLVTIDFTKSGLFALRRNQTGSDEVDLLDPEALSNHLLHTSFDDCSLVNVKIDMDHEILNILAQMYDVDSDFLLTKFNEIQLTELQKEVLINAIIELTNAFERVNPDLAIKILDDAAKHKIFAKVDKSFMAAKQRTPEELLVTTAFFRNYVPASVLLVRKAEIESARAKQTSAEVKRP